MKRGTETDAKRPDNFDFPKFERECTEKGYELARGLMREKLESLDEAIRVRRDKRLFRHKGKRTAALKTVAGEVSYARTYYIVTDGPRRGARVFLLDELLKLRAVGAFSENLIACVAEAVTELSYREAAREIGSLTGQTVSGSGIRRAALGAAEGYVASAKPERKERAVLFAEADGVYLSMQGRDRPRRGGKSEMKMGVFYDGRRRTNPGATRGKPRYETSGKILAMGFCSAAVFEKRMLENANREYDLDEAKYLFVNTDGAKWARGLFSDDENTVHQLDPFHRSRALSHGVADADARLRIREALRDGKIPETLRLIAAYRDSLTDAAEREKADALFGYFASCRDSLIPYDERGLDIPPPPNGLEYGRMGTMEHNVFDHAAKRMKRRKASWSRAGANGLGILLGLRASGGLGEAFGGSRDAEPRSEPARAAPLSAARTPAFEGRGYSYPAKAAMPFEGAAVTNGRKAVRALTRGE